MDMGKTVTIITVTLNRASLKRACESVDNQTYTNWHHIVLGDGVLPVEYKSSKRSTLGFSSPIGATEPGANMLNGTPNPLLRWALKNIKLGEYFCFLDDDNEYRPNFLEKMVDKIEVTPNVGIVLCGAEDLRYGQNIDGYPEIARCDNSAFIARSFIASKVEFPHASVDKNVIQDYEFIKLCSELYGWARIPDKLLIFGAGMNIPPDRGKVLFLESWKLSQQAQSLSYKGNYNEAEKIFLESLRLYRKDAWSWKKLAEMYILCGDEEKAKNAYNEWYLLFKEVDCNHVAAQLALGQFLCHRGENGETILKKSLIQRLALEKKEPEAIEHMFYVFITYVFLNDEEYSNLYFEICCQIPPDSILWAFNDIAWTLNVYKKDIKFNIERYLKYFKVKYDSIC